MNIVVVTHDGLPPAEGGIRLGYVTGGFFFPINGAAIYLDPIRRMLWRRSGGGDARGTFITGRLS